MKVIRARVPWIVIYLLCLSMYGFFMMMASLQQEGGRGGHSFSPYIREEGAEGETLMVRKIRRKRDLEDPITSVRDFFARLDSSQASCRKVVDVGGTSCKTALDGNKLLCLDDDVIIPHDSCNVYSFGVGDDISFDHQMSNYGCDVYMFDPTVPPSVVNESIYDKPKLHFFPLGISNKKFERSYEWPMKTKGKIVITGFFDTFDNVRSQIGHQGVSFQYLKMDIEGSEWDILPDLVSSKAFDAVSQFALEIHANRIINMTQEQAIPHLQDMWNVLKMVENVGFQRIRYTPTLIKKSMYYEPGSEIGQPTCGEIFYIRRR